MGSTEALRNDRRLVRIPNMDYFPLWELAGLAIELYASHNGLEVERTNCVGRVVRTGAKRAADQQG